MAQFLFFVAGIGAIAGAIGVVTFDNPFYCVLALVGHLISLAALFLLLRAEFVAAAQVIVYAGAVMVLYVFVVAYVGGQSEPLARGGAGLTTGPVGSGLRLGAALFGGALLVELCIAILGSALKAIDSKGAPFVPGFGTPAQIGQLLLTKFLLPFELASFLLLISAVAAVVLARRRRGLDDDDAGRVTPLELLRPIGTGTMAEGGGVIAPAAGVTLGGIGGELGAEIDDRAPTDRGGGGW